MKVVFVQHPESSKYFLFETAKDIQKGEHLLVNTMYGDKYATAISSSMEISDDSIPVFAGFHGAYLPLKKVIGKYNLEKFDEPKEEKSGVREVKRKAKTGEYIKIINAYPLYGDQYKNGDILKVACVDCDSGICADGIEFISREEYVVLEGYTDEMYQNYLKNKDDIKCLVKNG